MAAALGLGLFLAGCGGREVSGTGQEPRPEWNRADSGGLCTGGSGAEGDPWLITTAEALDAVRNDLTAHYRLGADIDLSGEDWTPIGAFREEGDAGNAVDVDAFMGTFDGGSHTISNLTVRRADSSGAGLFGFTSGARIYNLTLDNVSVDGRSMAGAVVGYAHNSNLNAVSLTGTNNRIAGHSGETGNAERVGGMVGAALNSVLNSCAARANVIVPDGANGVGILCGSLTGTSAVNCYATGTLSAGDACSALGVISGYGFGSKEFTNCAAENVKITVGDNAVLVGGVLGYAGGYEDEVRNVAVTAIIRCTAKNVEITTGENAGNVGGIIGGGFRTGENDAPGVFTIADCESDATVNGAELPLTGETTE